jgi:hypothetical protein
MRPRSSRTVVLQDGLAGRWSCRSLTVTSTSSPSLASMVMRLPTVRRPRLARRTREKSARGEAAQLVITGTAGWPHAIRWRGFIRHLR